MKMGLVPDHGVTDDVLDYMGKLLLSLIGFIRSKFDQNVEYDDLVKQERVKAGELFVLSGARWFVRSESLPGYSWIKALGSGDRRIWIESSPLDPVQVQELIVKEGHPFRYDAERGIVFNRVDTPVIRISKSEVPKFGQSQLAPRTLWAIQLRSLTRPGQDRLLIRFIDRLFDQCCFILGENEVSASGGAVAPGRLELQQSLGLVQELQIEQRPVLSLVQEQKLTGRPELQQLQLQKLLAVQQAIIRMDPEQLAKFTEEKLAELGAKGLLHLFNFVIAGKVKRVRPNLSWPEARKIARTLQTQS